MPKALSPLVLLALAALPAPAPAQDWDQAKAGYDVTILGKREVAAGGFAELCLKETPHAIWAISPAPVQRRWRAGWLYFTGQPGVAYTVVVVANDPKKGISNEAEAVVTFGPPGPVPPVPPGPQPPPDPPPDPPGPVAGPVKFLVVVEETADAAAGRGAFFADAALHARLKARGIGCRVVDKDVRDAAGQVPADVKRFVEKAAGRPMPRVYLVDEKGRTLFDGVLPDDPARLVELIGKYGG